MKFKVDENLPIEVAVALREAGHDAMSVVDQGLGGRADASVAEVCRREGRSLVTLDVDFANVQAYPPRDYAGLLVLRLQATLSVSGHPRCVRHIGSTPHPVHP